MTTLIKKRKYEDDEVITGGEGSVGGTPILPTMGSSSSLVDLGPTSSFFSIDVGSHGGTPSTSFSDYLPSYMDGQHSGGQPDDSSLTNAYQNHPSTPTSSSVPNMSHPHALVNSRSQPYTVSQFFAQLETDKDGLDTLQQQHHHHTDNSNNITPITVADTISNNLLSYDTNNNNVNNNSNGLLQESTNTLLTNMNKHLDDINYQQHRLQQMHYQQLHQQQEAAAEMSCESNEYNSSMNDQQINIPPPPPLPTHLSLQTMNTIFPQISTQQIIQQQKNLRPTTERGQDDKKKEALAFLSFYYRVVPTITQPIVSRTSVLALYAHKVDSEKRYKQPNDMANLCGAVYTFIYQHLDENSIKEYITLSENEKIAGINDSNLKKRKKKRTGQDITLHDAFLTCIKYSSLLPFLEMVHIDDLPNSNEQYISQHKDYLYTMEDLLKWDNELKDQKSNQSRVRTIVNLIDTKPLQFQQQPHQQYQQQLSPIPPYQNSPRGMRISLPVNVTETLDSFIIYAFIPFYKPNALKITVNQMEIVLEGVISMPETIQIPNGTEITVPNTIHHLCTQREMQEGSFYKVIKLSSPISSSTVGKRDGVVVIIATKEATQTTIHTL